MRVQSAMSYSTYLNAETRSICLKTRRNRAIPLLRSAEHSAELVWPRSLFYLIAQVQIRFLFYWPDQNQRELRFFYLFLF